LNPNEEQLWDFSNRKQKTSSSSLCPIETCFCFCLKQIQFDLNMVHCCVCFFIVLLHDPYLVFCALRFWFEGLVADCQLCTAYEGAPCLVCLPLSTDLRFFKAVSAQLARRLAVRAAGQSYCPFMLLKCSLFEQTVSQDVLKPSCAIARKLGRWCARENNWSF